MKFCGRLAFALLLVAVVTVTFSDAQGRGRGGRRPGGPGGRWGNRPQGGRPQRNQDGGAQDGGRPGGRQGGRFPGGFPGVRPGGSRGPGGFPGGRPRGQRPDGRPAIEGERYSWEQTLTTGETAEINTFIPDNKNVALVFSKGNIEAGVWPSRTLYDFNDAQQAVMVTRLRGPGPCFLYNTSLTLQDVTNGAIAANGTVSGVALAAESLDGTAEELDDESTAALKEFMPSLTRFCRNTNVVVVAPTGELPPFEGEIKDVRYLNYDQEMTLTIRAPRFTPGGRFPSGIPGDRPGSSRGRPGGFPGGRPGGRPDGRPAIEGERYSWEQTLSTGETVEINTFIPDNKNVALVFSKGNIEAGVWPSRTLYDFNDAQQAVMVTRLRGPGPCFLYDTSLTLQDVTDGAIAANGTVSGVALAAESLDGTAEKLDDESTAALKEFIPSLTRFCRNTNVVVVAPTGELPPFEGETKDVRYLNYDQEMTLTIRAPKFTPGGRGRVQGRGRGRG